MIKYKVGDTIKLISGNYTNHDIGEKYKIISLKKGIHTNISGLDGWLYENNIELCNSNEIINNFKYY